MHEVDVKRSMKRLAAALVILIAVAACAGPSPSTPDIPTSSPVSAATGTPPPVTPPPTATPPAETVRCFGEKLPASSPFRGDPCPSAVLAVRAIVASIGLPIVRVVIQPGGFTCGGPWPGPTSAEPICFARIAGALVLPGTEMHGWVAFAGSRNVAAVRLYRPFPIGIDTVPASSAHPSPVPTPVWTAQLVTYAVPPAGFAFP